MTLQLNAEQYKLYENYVIKVYIGNKSLLKSDSNNFILYVDDRAIDDFLDAADYAIIHFGMVDQDYLTPLGCELQLLYDEIYYQICNYTGV